MYSVPCHCWYCHQPYFIPSYLSYSSPYSNQYMSQPLAPIVTGIDYMTRAANSSIQTATTKEQSAHWSSPAVSEYAKKFDAWAR